MNIHLIRTPEYPLSDFQEVFDFLNTFKGQLKFVTSDYEFNPKQFPFLETPAATTENPEIANTILPPLSWSALFSLCDFYRTTFNKDNTDFVGKC